MHRVEGISLAIFLTVLAAGATFIGAVALWKAPTTAGASLSLTWLLVVALAAGTFRSGALGKLRIAIALLAALAMRLFSLSLVEGSQLGSDAMNYTNLAHAVMSGHGLVVDDFRYGNGLRAFFPPLYPVLLAGWWSIFGDSPLSTLAMNTLTDLTIAWLICDLGKRVGDRQVGQIAALIFLAFPTFALAAAIPHKQSVMIAAGLLFFSSLLVWQARKEAEGNWRNSAVMGLAWALMALTQAALALAPPIICLILAPRIGWRRTILFGLRALPFFLLVMAPWWIRNWMLFLSFVPFTTAAGFLTNVMLGENGVAFPKDLFAHPEPERSTIMAKLALNRIAEVPLSFLNSVLHAFAVGFAYEEAVVGGYRHSKPPISFELRSVLTPPVQFAYAAILGGASAACWRALRSAHEMPVIPIAFATLASTGIIGMWFEFGERHRFLMTPLLILLASDWIVRRRQPGQPSKLSATNLSSSRTP